MQPKLLSSVLALAIAIPVAPAAHADGSAFVGGLVGGIVGSAIGNAATQRRETVIVRQPQTRTVVRHAPVVNTYEREQNRQAQVALNHFGFPAGTPDGVMGRNSRAAAAQYQAFMGMPATGYLSDYDRTQLITAYNRALVGGPQNQQMMAAYGQGTRGLLLGYRDEQMGVPMPGATPVGATVMAAAPTPTPMAPVPAAPEQVAVALAAPAPAPVAEPAPVVEAAAPAEGALPDFLTATAPDASMASVCNRVSLVTSTNGGFVTVATLKDPGFALEEQFCLARTYAIEDGERLAATVQGIPAADIRARCEAFAPAMRPYVAMLAGEPAPEVAEAVRGFIVETGAPPAQIAANARICLGVGYRTDNAELALGSALVLAAAGEAAYGEHVGHHLMQGFGVARRADRGEVWLGDAVAAMQAGATAVVAPGAPERIALLRTALTMSDGGEVLSDAAAPAATVPTFVLPAAPASSN
ncbi:MAG: peptidoglycan-binding protein [Amaricoccus sp.]|nr:peptidoglycan-binding protein [Amaricoccus sp.]